MSENVYLEILFLVPSASISHYFPPPPTLMLLKENVKLDGIPSKIKYNMPVLHCISGFDIVSLLWLLYTSTDLDFYKFLELGSPLLEKYFCHKIYFFNGFTQNPPLSEQPNPPSVTKVFIDAPEWKTTKHSCQNKPSFVVKYSCLPVIIQSI